ncbi:MAG: single-stranded DNA-binding protein [Spirochaetes bacterium]|jgi:single-strand DNA-binding protein|nr:single-stranded DNA-binding protein [Spirochaetota bacterium]
MADINQVVLVGRLVRDAELRYLSSGTSVMNFSIAVNRRRKQGDQWVDEASFFDVELFGRQAESIQRFMVKGKQVGIQGELRQDRWEQDGQNRSKVRVHAINLQLLGGPGDGGQSAGGSGGGQSRPDQVQGGGNGADFGPPPANDDNFDDDVPF